jgi:hypothetical protein
MASRAWKRRDHLFVWRPVSVILIILTILYGAVACLNLWMGRYFSQHSQQYLSDVSYSGAFWDAVVAVLCFAGRRMIGRQTRVDFLLGACALSGAVLIVIRTLVGERRGRFPGQNLPLLITLIEAALILLPMLYSITYAVRESKRRNVV